MKRLYLNVSIILLLLISIIIIFLPHQTIYPLDLIQGDDTWGYISQSKEIQNKNIISPYLEDSNNPRLKIYSEKPIGFQVLIVSISSSTNISEFNLSFFAILFLFEYSILIGLITYKIIFNIKISLLSSIISLTFLSGGIGLGPSYFLPVSIDLILISSYIIIFKIFEKTKNILIVIISILFLITQILVHRPGMIILFIFIIMLIIYQLLKNVFSASTYFENISYHLVTVSFGILIAQLIWPIVTPISVISGGSKLFEVSESILTVQLLNILANIVLVLSCVINIYYLRKRFIIKFINTRIKLKSYFISNIYFKISLMILLFFPILIVIVILLSDIINQYGLNNVFGIIISSIFAPSMQSNLQLLLIKQIFYIWHFNILFLIFIIPSLMNIIQKKNWIFENFMSLFFLFSIFFITFLQMNKIIFENYFQSFGFITRSIVYFTPFVYSIITINIFYIIIKYKKIRKILLLLLISSLLISFNYAHITIKSYPSELQDNLLYINNELNNKELITSSENAAKITRTIHYNNLTGKWTVEGVRLLYSYAKSGSIHYLLIENLYRTNRVYGYTLYSNAYGSLYYIE